MKSEICAGIKVKVVSSVGDKQFNGLYKKMSASIVSAKLNSNEIFGSISDLGEMSTCHARQLDE